MMAIGLVIVISVIFSRVGWHLLRVMRIQPDSLLEEFVYATALGFIVLAGLVGVFGLTGALSAWYLWGLIGICGMLTLRQSIALCGQIWRSSRQWSFSSASGFEKIVVMTLGSYALGYFVVALAPPVLWDGIHHLFPLAQIYIRRHQIHFFPYLFAMRPKNMVMFYIVGFLLQGETLAVLFNYVLTLLLLGLIYARTRQVVSREYAVLAATIFYTMPLAGMVAAGSLSESGVALYGFAALGALLYWWETLQGQWLVLAGIFSGFCAGFKEIGIEVPLLIGFFVVMKNARMVFRAYSRKTMLAAGAACVLFIATASVTGLPWYLLTYKWTGTPLYSGENLDSMFSRYLAENKVLTAATAAPEPQRVLATSADTPSQPTLPRRSAPMVFWQYVQHGLSSLFRFGPRMLAFFAWHMSMGRDFQGYGVSPLYLAFMPLLLLFAPQDRRVYLLALFGGLYFMVGINLWGDYNRYIIPVFPIFAVIAAKVVHAIQTERLWAGQVSKLACLLIFALHFPVMIQTGINCLPAAVGVVDRETYLTRYFPGSFKVAQYANHNLPASSKLLLIGEFRLFLFEREYLPGGDFSLVMRSQDFQDPAAACQRLKSLGVTHVVLNQQVSNNAGYEDKEHYIENFKQHYLELIYYNSDVYLYVLRDA